MQGKGKPKRFFHYLFGCFFLAMLLVFGTGETAFAQKKKNMQQYPSTRSNKQQAKKGKKQKKVKFDPNTTKKFKPKSKRELRRLAKMKKKPQYSDPLYFGHKKKPKKRPPGKQKYCKECGMRH